MATIAYPETEGDLCRYLGDERFQLALSVGLGMNIMGGDQFREQQRSNGASSPSAPQPKSSPAQPEKPKQVLRRQIIFMGLSSRGCMQHLSNMQSAHANPCVSCIAAAMGALGSFSLS